MGPGLVQGLENQTASQRELGLDPLTSPPLHQWVLLCCLPEMAWHSETYQVSAAAVALAAACREDQAGHLAGREGRGNCSRDLARWAGKPDQVGTIPEGGNPCQIHPVREDQAQVGPSLVEVGKEETCWGFGIRVHQAGREDHWGQEAGWHQVRVLDEREPES